MKGRASRHLAQAAGTLLDVIGDLRAADCPELVQLATDLLAAIKGKEALLDLYAQLERDGRQAIYSALDPKTKEMDA